MNISINKHYNFCFSTTSFDGISGKYSDLNGIYFVERALVYNDLLKENIELTTSLYSKIILQGAMSDSVYKSALQAFDNAHVSQYLNDVFYKLISMKDGTSFIWISESLIVGYPDPNVKEYKRMMMITDLGVIEDPATLYAIKNIVTSALMANVGINAIYASDSVFVAGESIAYDPAVSHPTPSNHAAGEPMLPYYIDLTNPYNSGAAITNVNHAIGDPITYPDNLSSQSIAPIINLSVYGTKWMSTIEYDDLMKNKLLYTESVLNDPFVNYQFRFLEQKKLYEQACTKIESLEQLIIDISAEPPAPPA